MLLLALFNLLFVQFVVVKLLYFALLEEMDAYSIVSVSDVTTGFSL